MLPSIPARYPDKHWQGKMALKIPLTTTSQYRCYHYQAMGRTQQEVWKYNNWNYCYYHLPESYRHFGSQLVRQVQKRCIVCKKCECSNSEICLKFTENLCIYKNLYNHIKRCEAMSTMSKNAWAYWSKQWGIISRSCLSN